MIIVQETFIAKPGNASKLAKMFKEAMQGNSEFVHIMTDMTGQFNKVVVVSKYENLTEFENSWEKYMKDAEAMKRMEKIVAGYQDMYLTGGREIFRVW